MLCTRIKDSVRNSNSLHKARHPFSVSNIFSSKILASVLSITRYPRTREVSRRRSINALFPQANDPQTICRELFFSFVQWWRELKNKKKVKTLNFFVPVYQQNDLAERSPSEASNVRERNEPQLTWRLIGINRADPTSLQFPVFSWLWNQEDSGLTFTFRLSAVVSSNSFPSSKEISVVLKELWILMLRWAPLPLMLIIGFSNAARCRSVGATPGVQSKQHTSV